MSTNSTTSNKPTILIVPGAWQLTTAFEPFREVLHKSGYQTEIVKLPSVGGTELPLTGLPEDIAAIRAKLEPLVDAGKDVLLLTHSAGGVSGSAAVKGFDLKTRKSVGLPGGVTRVVYMGAFMIPKGSSLMEMLGGKPLPWMIIEVCFSHRSFSFLCLLEPMSPLILMRIGRSSYWRSRVDAPGGLRRSVTGGDREMVERDVAYIGCAICRRKPI